MIWKNYIRFPVKQIILIRDWMNTFMSAVCSAVTSQWRKSRPPGGDLINHLWISVSGVMTLSGEEALEKFPSRPVATINGLISSCWTGSAIKLFQKLCLNKNLRSFICFLFTAKSYFVSQIASSKRFYNLGNQVLLSKIIFTKPYISW